MATRKAHPTALHIRKAVLMVRKLSPLLIMKIIMTQEMMTIITMDIKDSQLSKVLEEAVLQMVAVKDGSQGNLLQGTFYYYFHF